jgi:putative ABC transport system permease protein
VAGAIIGFAISQLTVVLTSLRLTRVNIVRALKDLPEPASAANGRRWLIIGGMAIVAGVAGYVAAGTTPVVAMAAPAVALMGAIPWLGRVIAPRLATTICSALAMVWPALVFGVLPDVMGDPEVSLFLLQGIMLVGLATVLVAALSPVWLALADRLSGGGLASRLGLAHPLARPERTALLVSMYSLVIFTVTFMAVMNAVFTASTPTMAFQAGGGYDALVESNPTAELTAAELVARPDIERAVPIRRGVVDVLGNDGILDGYRVSYLPPDFAEVATPVLTGRATAFADDESAWAAAVSGQAGVANAGSSERWVIVPDWAPLDIGASTELVAENGDVEYVRIAGVTDLQWLVDGGILASAQLADPLVADSPVTRYYMQVADGLDSDEVVRALESDYVRRGVDGTTFMERALEEVQGQEVFLQMLQGYLGLGLLIGIAGLGVVLARAVRERRRQIGMMRAIGFSGSVMRRAFLLEAVFIGVQGVVLGIGLGLLSAWQIMAKSNAFEDNLTFDIPTAWLAGLAVLCLSASVAAAISPAIRSGRVSPAVALRH